MNQPAAQAGVEAAPGAATTAGATPLAVKTYLVEMADLPVATYDGRVGGYEATKISRGQKLDPESPAVSKYFARLQARHDDAMKSAGVASKLYDYGYVFNGFAAQMTDEQAQKLQSQKDVVSVQRDEARSLDTATTPAFLGLSGPSGVWAANGLKGENVVIGLVDSGIWPESLSFTDRVDANGTPAATGKLAYDHLAGWRGKCLKGENFRVSDCNRKLVGARYYHGGWTANNFALSPDEYVSARDAEGHGTHTASTSGGNAGVKLSGPLAALGATNGMAPRARIAAYKVCWKATAQVTGGCFQSDSVAAIDQAVADGVDVINFSISGSKTTARDSVEIAFMNAAAAGVFVAASAGNTATGESPVGNVAHPSPWLTTVAASTHNRLFAGSVTLGNAVVYSGISTAPQAASGSFVEAADVGKAGADPTQVRQCYSSLDGGNVLDPVKVAGKIVLCDRGVTARVNKSFAVAESGGIGMVLVNPAGTAGLVADFHSVPTVHIEYDSTVYAALHAYAHLGTGTATIAKFTANLSAPAPAIASFSYQGPSQANSNNLLKPDITGPGVDVLASVSPPGNLGRKFDLYSGTSMSSPHIAGIAALVKQAHPDWSPMMIKSALMTTAGDILDNTAGSRQRIWKQGAGHVNPAAALNPGVVFDSNLDQWVGFLCGNDLPTSFCTTPALLGHTVPVIDGPQFNVASISVSQLPGSITIHRTATNVAGNSGTYTASVIGLAGFTVTASPFSVTPGGTSDVSVTITNVSAPVNTYVGGQITYADGQGHSVRIPVIVRPVSFSAPSEVNGSYSLKFGYQGSFGATPDGLVPAVIKTGSVQAGDGVCTDFPLSCTVFDMGSMTGKTIARFQTFDGGALVPGTDIDIEVWCGTPGAGGSTKLGQSIGNTAAEVVTIKASQCAASNVFARVLGYTVPNGTANFSLYTWILDGANKGNMGLSAPASATLGTTGTVTIAPTGLTSGTKYMGAVTYTGTPSTPPTTIVRIDQP